MSQCIPSTAIKKINLKKHLGFDFSIFVRNDEIFMGIKLNV
jgi:hypothetical protein